MKKFIFVTLAAILVLSSSSLKARPARADGPEATLSGEDGGQVITNDFSPNPCGPNDVATQVSSGRNHACAVTTTGGVMCWGSNNYGQLGVGTWSQTNTPMQVIGMESGVTAVAVGDFHSCAIQNEALKCWGRNDYGQLGIGTWVGQSNTPVQVIGTGVTAVSAALRNSCAIQNGALWCWGSNSYGELGNGKTGASSNKPVEVIGMTPGVVTAVAVGDFHSCAIQDSVGVVPVERALKCWGLNHMGQLGNSTEFGNGVGKSYNSPLPVIGMTSGVTEVSAGKNHSCAIQDGALKCWGENSSGELGNGDYTGGKGVSGALRTYTPVQVIGMASEVTAVSAGKYHSCAIRSGVLKCWGSNISGELGNGTTSGAGSSTPMQVSGMTSGVTAVSGGFFHTYAIQNGAIRGWGQSIQGGTTTSSTTPVQVTGFQNTCSTIAIAPGQPPVYGDLSTCDCLSFPKPGRHADNFTFTAEAGVTYSINMQASSFDTYLYLLDSEGTVLTENNDSGVGVTDSKIIYTATSTGRRTIHATSSVSNTTGNYRVFVWTPNPSPPDCGWTGTGSTFHVAAGADPQTIINNAQPGDTVELPDGTWTGLHLTINKAIRLKAANPFRTILQGPVDPPLGQPDYDAEDGISIYNGCIAADDPYPCCTGAGTGSSTEECAGGAMIEGLHVRDYRGAGIGARSVRNATICGNRVESNDGQGIKLWDTVNATVTSNEILDPYRPNHVSTAIDDYDNATTNRTCNNGTYTATCDLCADKKCHPDWCKDKTWNGELGKCAPGSPDAACDLQSKVQIAFCEPKDLMDYGVQAYGTAETHITNNYFHGQFNQVISFKTANRDYSITGNTIEGFASTAVMLGQNAKTDDGPFSTSMMDKEHDRGTLTIDSNVLRPIVGEQNGAPKEYFGGAAFVVGNLDNATVSISNNTVEGCADEGIILKKDANDDCPPSGACGATGSLDARHNIINGKLQSILGVRNVGRHGLRIEPGVQMAVSIDHETYVNMNYAIRDERGVPDPLDPACQPDPLDPDCQADPLDPDCQCQSLLRVDNCIFANGTFFYPGAFSNAPVNRTISSDPAPTGAGVGNITPLPATPIFVNSATPPLLFWSPTQFLGTTDFRVRFKPPLGSPADLGSGKYAGAVSP